MCFYKGDKAGGRWGGGVKKVTVETTIPFLFFLTVTPGALKGCTQSGFLCASNTV